MLFWNNLSSREEKQRSINLIRKSLILNVFLAETLDELDRKEKQLFENVIYSPEEIIYQENELSMFHETQKPFVKNESRVKRSAKWLSESFYKTQKDQYRKSVKKTNKYIRK